MWRRLSRALAFFRKRADPDEGHERLLPGTPLCGLVPLEGSIPKSRPPALSGAWGWGAGGRALAGVHLLHVCVRGRGSSRVRGLCPSRPILPLLVQNYVLLVSFGNRHKGHSDREENLMRTSSLSTLGGRDRRSSGSVRTQGKLTI